MMNSQEVPQGYKQTKVGVIPEDWDVVKIEDIADVKGGKRLPKGYNLIEEIIPFPFCLSIYPYFYVLILSHLK